jgi:hypothetical protein
MGMAGTSWAGQTGYRIQLRNFQRLEPPLTKSEITATEKLRSQLTDIRASHPNLFYDPNLTPAINCPNNRAVPSNDDRRWSAG